MATAGHVLTSLKSCSTCIFFFVFSYTSNEAKLALAKAIVAEFPKLSCKFESSDDSVEGYVRFVFKFGKQSHFHQKSPVSSPCNVTLLVGNLHLES